MPITFDVSQESIDALAIKPGSRIALRDPRDDEPLAILTGLLLRFSFPSRWIEVVRSRGHLQT
jgi:hypothetical protein